jgi:thiol-disulfide isomerase/thioredoxin
MSEASSASWSRLALPLGIVAVLGIAVAVMMDVPDEVSTTPERSAGVVQQPSPAGTQVQAPRAAATASPKTAADAAQPISFSFTSLDGREWSSESLRGKVVFVDFWATWCGPCVATIPELAQLSRAFPDDVVVLGVSKEPVSTVTSFIKGRDIPYPLVAGQLPGMPYQFRTVRSIPTIFVIDRDGRISNVLVGRHSFSQLSAAFRAADALPARVGG